MKPLRSRVLRTYSWDDFRLEETDVPPPGPEEIRCRLLACGVCSGEGMPWYINRKAKKNPGLCLGHELVAEIVDVGTAVDTFLPGERVFAHHHAPCHQCEACEKHLWAHCRTWQKNTLDPGGYSEYFVVDANAVAHDTLPIPPGLDTEDAIFIEPLACCVRALENRGQVTEWDTVWVVGLGAMGLLNVLLARALGAKTVLATDYNEERRIRAAEWGALVATPDNATKWVMENTGGHGADVVCFCPPSSRALEGVFDGVAPGGRIVLFAPPEEGGLTKVDFNPLYFKEATITSAYSCGPDETHRALEHLKEERLAASHLITHRVTLEQVPEMLRLVADPPEGFLKAMALPERDNN